MLIFLLCISSIFLPPVTCTTAELNKVFFGLEKKKYLETFKVQIILHQVTTYAHNISVNSFVVALYHAHAKKKTFLRTHDFQYAN